MIETRSIPGSDVTLSTLTFGSMRMHDRDPSPAHWQGLLEASLELGVSSCHSSDEYASFPLFCEVMGRLRNGGVASNRLQHIVKLADPHFGEHSFDSQRLRARIDRYLSYLGVARIDVVQWMWRGDLKQEQHRLDGFREQTVDVATTFAALVKEGKVGAFSSFPYTDAFAHRILGEPWCRGLALYVNPLELESSTLIASAAAQGRAIIALRPLAAGRALQEGHPARAAVEWTLAQPRGSDGRGFVFY